MKSPAPAVVLFDGVCNFCNGAVHFVVDRDPEGRFHFAALQSAAAARLLRERGSEPPAEPESVLLLEGERLHARSTAALRIARRLRWPWPLLYGLILVPRPLRDLIYRYIARNRYAWFGRSAECRVPTPALRARFVE